MRITSYVNDEQRRRRAKRQAKRQAGGYNYFLVVPYLLLDFFIGDKNKKKKSVTSTPAYKFVPTYLSFRRKEKSLAHGEDFSLRRNDKKIALCY